MATIAEALTAAKKAATKATTAIHEITTLHKSTKKRVEEEVDEMVLRPSHEVVTAAKAAVGNSYWAAARALVQDVQKLVNTGAWAQMHGKKVSHVNEYVSGRKKPNTDSLLRREPGRKTAAIASHISQNWMSVFLSDKDWDEQAKDIWNDGGDGVEKGPLHVARLRPICHGHL